MRDKVFVDTNILVYAYDYSDPVKSERATHVINYLVKHQLGVISTQVLSEFFVTVTRKIPERLSLLEARERVQAFVQVWTVVDVTGLVVLEAFRGMEVYRFSYWDAQIWAVAKLNQIPVILSEDFNVGSVIEGIRFENPLADDFSIDM